MVHEAQLAGDESKAPLAHRWGDSRTAAELRAGGRARKPDRLLCIPPCGIRSGPGVGLSDQDQFRSGGMRGQPQRAGRRPVRENARVNLTAAPYVHAVREMCPDVVVRARVHWAARLPCRNAGRGHIFADSIRVVPPHRGRRRVWRQLALVVRRVFVNPLAQLAHVARALHKSCILLCPRDRRKQHGDDQHNDAEDRQELDERESSLPDHSSSDVEALRIAVARSLLVGVAEISAEAPRSRHVVRRLNTIEAKSSTALAALGQTVFDQATNGSELDLPAPKHSTARLAVRRPRRGRCELDWDRPA